MCPSPHLCFLQGNSDFCTRIACLYVSLTSPVVLWMQNRVISTSILVSMGPSPHLWFLLANQRLLDQNCMSLWVPALICGFCMQNCDFWTRITSFYLYQTAPVALCMQNSVITIRITSLYGSQPSSVFFVPDITCPFVYAK